MEISKLKKKAQIVDLLYMSMILVMIAVVGMITYKVISDVTDQFEEDDTIGSEAIAYTQNYEDRLPGMLQQLFMIALVGISIVTLVASFMVLSHPVFYGLMFIVLAFMTWVNSIYANFYQEFASTVNFGELGSNIPMITYVMQYFPLLILVLSIIIVVVMVAKGGGQ